MDVFKHQLILPVQVEAELGDDICFYRFVADGFTNIFMNFSM